MLPQQLSRNAASRRTKKSRQRHRQAYRRRFSRPQLEFLEKRLLLAQDLLIANPEADNILRFEGATGDPLGEFVSANSGGLVDPIDPTFGPDGNLYVISSEAGHEKILRYDGGDGSFIGTFIDTGAGGFSGASAIEFGPDGDLYVATNTSAGVLRYDGATGAFETAIAAGEVARASGIAFGPDNNLYVMDSDGFLNTFADRITRYDPATGNQIDEFVAPGNLDDVAYFTFGPDGHLYVPDVSFNDIRRFNGTTGEFEGIYVSLAPNEPSFDIRFGTDGSAYVSNGGVERFDVESGDFIDTFIDGQFGTATFVPSFAEAVDLEVLSVQIPAGAVQGEQLTIAYEVRNSSATSTAGDQWTDVAYFSLDDVFDPSDQEVGRVDRKFELPAGGQYTETITVAVPATPIGLYHVFVIADRRGETSDQSRANNLGLAPTTLLTYPPLCDSHDAAGSITVGRTASSQTMDDINDDRLSITYTAYNATACVVDDVLLTTTLQTGVALDTAEVAPERNGETLAWALGSLAPYGRASVTIEVALSNPVPSQIDGGAAASGSIDGWIVRDSAPPLLLATGPFDPAVLASTPDANTDDPVIQEKAAELDYDPLKIADFLTHEIGYQSYSGSLRGGRGTLWSGAGNSLDEASLGIALFRASGIPARYVAGTLNEELSQQLILSMFPADSSAIGFVQQDFEVGDPVNDPQLVAETAAHYWIQLDVGGGFEDFDPTFADATIGATYADEQQTFTEVSPALRHRTTIRLNAEFYHEANTLFGLSNPINTKTVLEETFDTVALVGRPISIGHFVNQRQTGAVITARTITYSPYYRISDTAFDLASDEIFSGESYQEVFTNFPFGNQILTGVFIELDVIGIDGTTSTSEHVLLDRIGAANRDGAGGDVSISPDDGPAFSPFDATTINVLPGKSDPRALARAIHELESLNRRLLERGAQSGGLQIDPGSPDSELMWTSRVALNRLRLAHFLSLSELVIDAVARDVKLAAYQDSPRITIAKSLARFNADGRLTVAEAIDLNRNDMRVVVSPGQAVASKIGFQMHRGFVDSEVEAVVLGTSAGSEFNVTSADTIIQAAVAEGATLVVIGPGDETRLETLDISADVKARILRAITDDKLAVVPDRAIDIAGNAQVAWYEIDLETGDTIGVLADGSHGAISERVAALWVGFALGFSTPPLIYVGGLLAQKYGAPDSVGSGAGAASTLWGVANELFPNLKNPKHGFAGGKHPAPFFFFFGFLAGLWLSIYLSGKINPFLLEQLKKLPGDPPLPPFLFGTEIVTPGSFSNASFQQTVQPTLAGGNVSGALGAQSVRASGAIDINSSDHKNVVNRYAANTLTVVNGELFDADGNRLGTGDISMSSIPHADVTLTGVQSRREFGVGRVLITPSSDDGIAVVSEWDELTATFGGELVAEITTNSLLLNNTPLPMGNYSIVSESLTLQGSGSVSHVHVEHSLSISAEDAVVEIGPGSTGNLTVGTDNDVFIHGIALNGYTGSLDIASDAESVAVSLQGAAEHQSHVIPSNTTFSADHNTPTFLTPLVQSSLGGPYDIVVDAPEGWTVEALSDGSVSVLPKPGAALGTHFVNLTARSQHDPALRTKARIGIEVESTDPGVSLSVDHDTVFFLDLNGGQVPTVFRATVGNQGQDSDVFDVLVPQAPPGFEVIISNPELRVDGGRSAVTGINLVPTGPLSPPGTTITFDVVATSDQDPTVTAMDTVSYTIDDIHGLAVNIDPIEVTAIPGETVTLELLLQSTGNVAEEVSFETQLSDGLAVSNLQSVSLAPGSSQILEIGFTPDASVPLNSILSAIITADIGTEIPVVTQVFVSVSAPGVAAVNRAATAVRALNDTTLGDRLEDLGIGLTRLVQEPDNALFKEQVRVLLDNTISFFMDDTDYNGFVGPLSTARDGFNTASTAEAISTAIESIGNVLDDFGEAVGNLAAHQFALSLSPNTLVAQPLVPAPFVARVHNLGTATTSYSLALAGVPDGVTATLDQDTLTLAPGEFADVPGSLTQVSTTELVDFDFSVDVAVTGITTQIQESAIGSVRPRNEIVSVTGIDVVPPFGDPGTQVNLTARLLNAVNRQQAALVSYSVTDPGGSTVFESPTPVPASLTVQTSLVSVDLGNLDTSGFAQGQHTIKVTVADADGNAIPGADATTPLIIGSPVEATLTVGPQVVPPGVSTVTNTLQVFGKVPLGVGTLKLVGMLPIEAFTGNFDNVDAIQGITLGGDTAYVHGNALGIGSLHVVDLSDPTAPTRTRAEIGIVSTAGAIDGDRLFAVDEGTTASGFSTLHVFDLNGGSGGTLEDPLLRDSISVPYIFGQDLVVSGDSVFTAEAQVRFNGPNLLEQNGTILSFDASDPADVQFLDSLFDVNGTTDDGNPNMGGNFYTRAFALADPTTLLVTSSTSTGSDTQTGTGRLLVVDVADPAAINSDDPNTQNAVVTELLIPGTTLIADIVVHGEMAYVIGSTGGFKNGDETDRAPTGDLVLASINISDPRNPVLTHTETLTRAARGALNLTVLGPGWLAISSLGDATADTPQLITIDVTDPGSFSFDQQLELTGTPEGMAADATHLYVTQSDGLFVYELRPDDPLELLAVAPVAGAAGVAVQNDIAYACGTDGISVLDYSNPASPTVVDTVGTGSHRGCRVDGDLLVAIRDPTARTMAVDVYSIQNDPLLPVLLGSSPAIQYANLESGIELIDSHAFVSQFGVCVQTRPATGNIVGMMGELLSVAFNLDDPDSPTSATPELADALFNTFGDNNSPPTDVGGCALSGGDHNVFGLTLAGPDLAYLAAGSATVANPGGGVGRIHVVDISNPGAAQVVTDVDLPGTQQALGIGIAGNYGVVIGSTTGWNNPFDGFRAGNLTVTSLDLSDPLDPRVISTKELDRPARSFWTNFGSLGNNLFGFSSQNWQSDTQRDAKLLLIDLSNPLDPYVIETEVELDTVPPNSITADGDLLFTTDAGGVSIYRIGDLPRIPFTAQVQIPRNSGVSVVEASFNLPPDQIIANDPDFDTLVWNLALTPDADLVNLTWDTVVTALQPGQSRAITLDTTVDFAYQSAPGQLTLAAQSVAVQQLLAINPSGSAAQPGGKADFTLSVMNPRDVDVTYDLSSSGVPADWIDLVSQVVVPAAGSVDVPLTLRPDSNAVLDDYGFVITATSHGTTGDVEGSLTVAGDPILPPIDRAARGVWVELKPMSATAGQGTSAIYTARVYNTGSESDEFVLFVSGLPAEFDTTINAGIFSVPAGASNFREFPVRITPPAGTAAAEYPFTVTAASVDHVSVTGPAAGSLTVVDVGVDVEIVPTSTDPETSVQMTITNTGTVPETFDVSLAAPAALAATLGTATVSLQPSQSQTVTIDLGEIDFAFPGTLQLIGSARSQTQPTVLDAQSIDVNIAAVRAMTAEFERDTRTLPLPGVSSFLLLVDNVGNVEDEYTARIFSTDGPVSAALKDLDGVPAQEIPLFVLPGLSRGGIVLDTELTGFGTGTVTVQVRSLNDATILAEDTITVMTDAEFDFGDAPEGIQIEDLVSNYPTRLGSGGARHALVDNGPRLGPSIDVEPNGQPSELADGDGIDEDGVIQIASFVSTASQSTLGSVLIDVSGTAKLDAWIDFNRNGRFDHPAEHLGSGTSTALVPGANIVPVTVPPGASVGTTYARFRISTLGGLAPGGEADDGEVEDYRFEILDGTSGADAIVNLIVGDVNVIGEGGDVVVLHETTELFRVPGAALAGLGFQGTDEDDLLSLGNLGAVLNAPIPIGFHGSGGSDTLKLADRDQLLDLTDDDLNPLGDIEVIDVVGASPNHLILDVVSVVASTDIDNSLLVIHDDDDTVHYAGAQWTVNLPIFVDGAQRHHLTGGGATVETLNTRPWTNPYIRTDVDRSGSTSPRDALLIINLLGREAADTGSVALPDPTSAETIADWYYDVNGSRFASPLDALQVINFIAVQQESEGAAGEALLAADLLTRRSALGDATESLQSLDTAIRNAPMSSLSIDRSWPLPTGRRHWPETADTDLELSFVDGNRERSLGELDAIDYSLANDPAQPFLWRLENGELDATLADCSLQSLGHTDKS
ncbi:Ubp3 associated protein Bre5 [Stieleria maiorica]|uniref:Ubp3 associated protein Bre5 n=1 Tax=Stieleria maiorica TaxID=2795974 RepID=A0A5B9M9S8_9BACT|nr:GEVED domain-containing protein [Stieleria maiorica]QEF97962.1 Ubp3 associated protein Bre5 [Stieleria maiorica]